MPRKSIAALSGWGLLAFSACASPALTQVTPALSPPATATTTVPSSPAASVEASASPAITPEPTSPEGCTSGENAYAEGQLPRGAKGEPVDVARAALIGLLSSDVLTVEERSAAGFAVIVSREGSEPARLEFIADGRGGWLLSQWSTCQGLSTR